METLHYIGIDIGATRIKMGIVTQGGRLMLKDSFDTAGIRGPLHFVTSMKKAIEDMLKNGGVEKDRVGALGVGAPGWVDHQGIVRELTNIPDWKDVALAEDIERAIGLKSFADNDANVMAAGELIHGAGRGRNNFVCLTLGTGVGGAIVIDGRIHRGAHGLAGEIGHMTLDWEGPRCVCGAAGCLENYVGNRFITARALQRIEELPKHGSESPLLKMASSRSEEVTTKLLAEAAREGDEIALEVWREAGRRLGTAMACLVNVLNPECFIVGGGVANAGAVLFDPMKEALESLAMNRLGYSTPILRAELGEDAGIIGAATFAAICSEGDQSPTR